jgi:predicted PolB exonuclease-like 3'-5' exonuclease
MCRFEGIAMRLFIDIETIPTQRPDVIAAIRTNAETEAAAKAEGIRRQYKKPETVEAHLAELRVGLPALQDEAYRKTALDGGYGEVLCIGWAINDEPAQSLIRKLDEPEVGLLRSFFAELPVPTMTALHWIGHNIAGFDLRFLWQRCLVHRIRPGVPIPVDGRDGIVTDTMMEWAGRWSRDKWPSLEELCRIFRVSSSKSGVLDGSKVWDFAQAGRFDEIAAYCRSDVEVVRQVYRAMSFAEAA